MKHFVDTPKVPRPVYAGFLGIGQAKLSTKGTQPLRDDEQQDCSKHSENYFRYSSTIQDCASRWDHRYPWRSV
jgi:hypothetical protein